MSRFQVFHYCAAATALVAAAAAVVAIVNGDVAAALVAATLTAITVLIVLADRRMLKSAERRSHGIHKALRPLGPIRSTVDSVRSELGDLRSERGALESEIRATRAGLEGLRAELRGLRGDLRGVRVELSSVARSAEAIETLQARQVEAGEQIMQTLAPLPAAASWAEQQRESHFRTLEWRMGKLHADLVSDTQALHQLIERYHPGAPLPPLAGWAVNPAGLAAILDYVERRGARTVVECGSGASTLWLAYALRAVGSGKVIALEHQEAFAAKTQAVVDAHGLTDWVDIRHAPLVPTTTPRGEFSWYDFDPASIDGTVDLLLVDGPPGDTGPTARYPALPAFRTKLSPDAVIIADDTERADEMQTIEYWLEDDPSLTRADQVGGYMEIFTFNG